MYVYVVVNYLFYGGLEGLVYIYVSAWKKYTLGDIPTVDCRIASSWVKKGILGSEMLVKCNFPVLPFKKNI